MIVDSLRSTDSDATRWTGLGSNREQRKIPERIRGVTSNQWKYKTLLLVANTGMTPEWPIRRNQITVKYNGHSPEENVA